MIVDVVVEVVVVVELSIGGVVVVDAVVVAAAAVGGIAETNPLDPTYAPPLVPEIK